MTVTRVSTPHHYVGLAADEKPTQDVPPGSRFYEVDTGLEFIFDGTDWYQRIFPIALPAEE